MNIGKLTAAFLNLLPAEAFTALLQDPNAKKGFDASLELAHAITLDHVDTTIDVTVFGQPIRYRFDVDMPNTEDFADSMTKLTESLAQLRQLTDALKPEAKTEDAPSWVMPGMTIPDVTAGTCLACRKPHAPGAGRCWNLDCPQATLTDDHARIPTSSKAARGRSVEVLTGSSNYPRTGVCLGLAGNAFIVDVGLEEDLLLRANQVRFV